MQTNPEVGRRVRVMPSGETGRITRVVSAADGRPTYEVECFQSNHEGAIVDLIQARNGAGLVGAVINPGGLTHTSVVLHDAIKAVDYPFVEVHISNVHAREEFRRHSYVSPAAKGVIAGLGWRGYEAAIRALVALARESAG